MCGMPGAQSRGKKICVKDERAERVMYIYIYFFLVAFSADFVTVKIRFSSSITGKQTELTLAAFLGLLHRLNDTNSNGLPHVTDCETTKRWVLRV
jgi:hypothetical protein